MINEATRQYIGRHKDDDVRTLALRGCKDEGVNLQLALQQIQGRQTARRKLPSWADNDAIVYPPHLSMEQCSSECTARYKARLASRMKACQLRAKVLPPPLCTAVLPPPLCAAVLPPLATPIATSQLIDLSGGLGVDFAFMAEAFGEAVYVERDEQLCAIAAHNFQALGLHHVTTVCAEAEGFLARNAGEDLPPALARRPFIYIDPARRNANGEAAIVKGTLESRKFVALADCTPNVVAMMPALLRIAACVMLKLSPMLDWRKAVADLAPHHVSEVHTVAVDNECKELLILLNPPTVGSGSAAAAHGNRPRLVCTDIHSRTGTYTIYTPRNGASSPSCSVEQAAPGAYLYEPNAAIMKAGCFNELAADFAVCQLSANSHLYCTPRLIDDFPGRRFLIQATCSMNKRELRTTIGHLKQANIAVRNFPLTADQLRQRLRLADGGTYYIFATTLADGSHTLLLCSK